MKHPDLAGLLIGLSWGTLDNCHLDSGIEVIRCLAS